jgi:hypothetical protein
VLGEADKVHLRAPVEQAAKPLTALYRLSRTQGRVFEIVEERPPDPRAVLGSTFLRYLTAPERLSSRLELLAALSRTVRVFEVRLPAGQEARDAAARLEEHLREESE